MKITVDGSAFYAIPNTHYCISANRAIYSTKTHSYISREGTTVRLSIGGIQGRYSCDKLLIDALLAHIDDIHTTINGLF